MPPRRAKPGDSQHVLDIPSEKIGAVIGAKGVVLKSISEKYDVAVNIPDKAQQGPVATSIQIVGQDILGCIQELERICEVDLGSGSFGGPQQMMGGGGGGMRVASGGASGGGGAENQVFVFRVSPHSRELQLLLQCHANGDWSIPQGRGSGRDFPQQLLQGFCLGAGDISFEQFHFLPNTIKAGQKFINHALLANAPELADWYPFPADVSLLSHADAFPMSGCIVQNSSVWVDVSSLLGGRIPNKEVSLWFKHNAASVIPQIIAVYGAGAVIVSGFSDSASAPTGPWAASTGGMMIMQNFKDMVDLLTSMDQATFISAVESTMNPTMLMEAMRKWVELGGTPLTHPPDSIPPPM